MRADTTHHPVSKEAGSFGLTSFWSLITCDKLFGKSCTFSKPVLCTLFVGQWQFGCRSHRFKVQALLS